MCQLLERVLADIETEAVLASKELLEKKPLFEEAEALQRTLVAHGCSHARPDWLRSHYHRLSGTKSCWQR